jgi:hypothetical protein
MEALVLDDAFEAELESELQMVREAILLVASGAARRVVVANLRHGRVILEPARAFAADLGLCVTTVPTSDPRRVDLAAERPTPVTPRLPA